MPHSAGAETLANAVKGDPDVVEKDRLRGSPYLLYNWSLRGDPVSTPFVSRCWRPAFGQGKLSRAPNKISTTESPPAQAPEQRQFNPPSNLLHLHRHSQLPSGVTYPKSYLPTSLSAWTAPQRLSFLFLCYRTDAIARPILTQPADSTENPTRWRKQEAPTTTPSRSSSKLLPPLNFYLPSSGALGLIIYTSAGWSSWANRVVRRVRSGSPKPRTAHANFVFSSSYSGQDISHHPVHVRLVRQHVPSHHRYRLPLQGDSSPTRRNRIPRTGG